MEKTERDKSETFPTLGGFLRAVIDGAPWNREEMLAEVDPGEAERALCLLDFAEGAGEVDLRAWRDQVGTLLRVARERDGEPEASPAGHPARRARERLGGVRRARASLGRVSDSRGPDFWELRIQERAGAGVVAIVRLTAEQLAYLMSGTLVVDVELEMPSEGSPKP